MRPRLLLALALLGSACAHRPDAPEEPREDAPCPEPRETLALSLAQPLGGATFRYVIVTRCQSFDDAQRVCARCYRGRLASVHSYSANSRLRRRARLCTNRGQVWIGAVTSPLGQTIHCRWSDGTRWDYSHWGRGSPRRAHRFCTALCTNNGLWRSVNCRQRLPFICEY